MRKALKMQQITDGDLVDIDTGSIYEKERYTVMIDNTHTKIRKKWFMIFQEVYQLLALDKDIRGEPRSILDLMFSVMKFQNKIPLHQSQISKILSINQSNVSKAIKKLIDKEIIVKDHCIGRNQFYKLHPNYGWKGKSYNMMQEEIKIKHEKVHNTSKPKIET